MHFNFNRIKKTAKKVSLMAEKASSASEAYCVKCKAKREMKDAKEWTMKNHMRALKGTCVKCGTKMNKILGKAK